MKTNPNWKPKKKRVHLSMKLLLESYAECEFDNLAEKEGAKKLLNFVEQSLSTKKN